MNERIRQLWSQAGGHYNSGNQHTWPEYTIDDPEKFADLIVEECSDLFEIEWGEEKLTGNDVGYVLKKHFRVEEK